MKLLISKKVYFSKLYRKMIKKHCGSNSPPMRCGISTVSSKENRPSISPDAQIPKTPTRIIKSQSIHPAQQDSSHWTTSTAPVFPLRATSPNAYPPFANTHRTEIIQLGGRMSCRTQRDNAQLEDSRRINLSPDGANRKISMLEGRIKQLHRQKQQTVIELNQKLNKLQIENDRLIAQLHQTSQNARSKNENTDSFDATNLEEMLSAQININLELRDEVQALSKEICTLRGKEANWEMKFKNSESEKNDLIRVHKEALAINRKEIDLCMEREKDLQQRLRELEDLKVSRNTAIEALIQEKQKRILELEEDVYSRSSFTELKEREISALEEDLSSEKLDNAQLREQLQSMKAKIAEQDKQECKKCKELLHTVFRLNTQLNKK